MTFGNSFIDDLHPKNTVVSTHWKVTKLTFGNFDSPFHATDGYALRGACRGLQR